MANGATTIQVSVDLIKQLKGQKMFPRESYEDVIRNLLEDCRELNEETKEDIEKARAEIRAGKYYTLEEVKRELGR